MTTKRHEERALEVVANFLTKEGAAHLVVADPDAIEKAISSALAEAEQELVREMMEPVEAMLSAAPLSAVGDMDHLNAAIFKAMLCAFCEEKGIPLPETEDHTGGIGSGEQFGGGRE